MANTSSKFRRHFVLDDLGSGETYYTYFYRFNNDFTKVCEATALVSGVKAAQYRDLSRNARARLEDFSTPTNPPLHAICNKS